MRVPLPTPDGPQNMTGRGFEDDDASSEIFPSLPSIFSSLVRVFVFVLCVAMLLLFLAVLVFGLRVSKMTITAAHEDDSMTQVTNSHYIVTITVTSSGGFFLAEF